MNLVKQRLGMRINGGWWIRSANITENVYVKRVDYEGQIEYTFIYNLQGISPMCIL